MKKPYRKPARSADSATAVTSRIKPNALPAEQRGMIAQTGNDITVQNYSTTLRPQDDTLIAKGRGKGIGLYREVMRDGRCYTVLQKRKRALVARSWEVTPASETDADIRAAEIVTRQLLRLGLDRLALSLLDAQLMGFSTVELMWDIVDGEIAPVKAKKVRQERIVFDAAWNPRLLTRDNMMDGIALPDRKFLTHRFDDDGSDPYGRGLGSILFWHVLFKREGVAFWLKAMERFAVPLPVAKHPYGMLKADQEALLYAVSSAVVNGAIVVPAGTDIEFAKAAMSGNMQQELWVRYWDEQSAETVLGETLTTNLSGSGSRAAAEVHKGIKDELIDADADELAGLLNETIVPWITAYNAPDAQPPSLSWSRPQNLVAEESGKRARTDRQRAEIDMLLAMEAKGYTPDDMPAALTAILGQKVVVAARRDLLSGSALTPSFSEPGGNTQLAAIVDQLDAKAMPIRKIWIERIKAAIDELLADGGDLADLPTKLLELYPQLETKDLAAIIGEALTLGEIKGRADLMDEIGK